MYFEPDFDSDTGGPNLSRQRELTLKAQISDLERQLATLKNDYQNQSLQLANLQSSFDSGRDLSYQIFDALPGMLMMFNDNGHCTLTNRSFAALIKANREDIIGRHISTFMALPGQVSSQLDKVNQGIEVRNHLVTIKTDEGENVETVWSINRASAFVGDRTVTGYLCIGRTTAVVQADNLQTLDSNRQLRIISALTERMRSSLDIEKVLQTIVDELGRLLKADYCLLVQFEGDANPRHRPILTHQYRQNEPEFPQAWFDLPAMQILFSQTVPVIINNVPEQFGEGTLATYRLEHSPPQSLLSVPVLVEGQLLAFLSVAYNQQLHTWTETEIKLLQAVAGVAVGAIRDARLFSTVQAERERSTAVLNSMGEGVIAVDYSGNISLINPVAEQLLALETAALLGQSATRLPFVAEPQAAPTRLEMGDRILSVTITQLNDQRGGYVCLIRDVTEEARLEKLKEDFLVLVSHEFRTPTTAILGALEILADDTTGPLTELQKSILQMAQNNGGRMRELLSNVIDIMALQSGQMQLRRHPTLIANALEQALNEDLLAVFNQKQIKLKIDVASVPHVLADDTRLIQIFKHLLSNASKYAPEGSTVKIKAKPERGTGVRVSISDQGIGLSLPQQNQLGQKFFRVDNSLTRTIGGSGLGLSITKSLLELQGGYLEVESTQGKGSTFSFVLPAA